jgi:hypothetical protein
MMGSHRKHVDALPCGAMEHVSSFQHICFAPLQRQELQQSTSISMQSLAAANLADHAEPRAVADIALTDELLADQLLADEVELGLDSQQVLYLDRQLRCHLNAGRFAVILPDLPVTLRT